MGLAQAHPNYKFDKGLAVFTAMHYNNVIGGHGNDMEDSCPSERSSVGREGEVGFLVVHNIL